jgi:Tol biopolymer transport system component
MSPEQASGEKVDARADLISLGAVIYEMTTGRRPFPKPLDFRRPVSPAAHPELDRIILKLLEPSIERRYQSASEVVADLKRLQETLSTNGTPSRRWITAGLAFALATILTGAAFWFWSLSRPQEGHEWVQLTNLTDSVVDPAVSADGRMLTFIRGADTFFTQGQVYVKILPDGDPVQLTRDDSAKMSPVFSPDGSRIAYTTVSPGHWDTWVVPVLGGEPREWLPNASGLTWIDGKHVLFSEMKKPAPHLAIVTAEESRVGARDLYMPPHERGMAHRSYPSPDGKWALVVEMDHNGLWLPCRLLPMDGTAPGRQVGPPTAECTFAAWSPDGRWMYLSSKAGGGFHTWRQRFPDGQPEQITGGLTEEEGIAIMPDGRSFITAVALRHSSVWLHDSGGDRQISLEGNAFQPKFSPDGNRLYYRILKSGSITSASNDRDPTELWVADLATGRTEPAMPAFPIHGRQAYDIAADGRRAVVSTLDREGKSRLWVASLDRRSAPHQIPNVEGYQPMFGPPPEILFHSVEGNTEFVYRVREDGTGLRKAVNNPVFEIKGVSPDGQWVVGFSPISGKDETVTAAFPLAGGPPVIITKGGHAALKWSADGKFLVITPGLFAQATKSYVIPLASDQQLPQLPTTGLAVAEFSRLPAARVIEFGGDVTPGPTADVYAFTRETVQRNLYRIPIR